MGALPAALFAAVPQRGRSASWERPADPADAQQVWAWRPRRPGPRARAQGCGAGSRPDLGFSAHCVLTAVGDLGVPSKWGEPPLPYWINVKMKWVADQGWHLVELRLRECSLYFHEGLPAPSWEWLHPRNGGVVLRLVTRGCCWRVYDVHPGLKARVYSVCW